MPGLPLKEIAPFRLIIGSEDLTQLLDESFSFSSKDPGGFESASFSVPRDLPQTLRGTYVRLDCGLDVAFEGRVSQIQRSLGHRTQIQCEGFRALLADDDASMVFVDRDLTRWQDPPLARQIALASAPNTVGSAQVATDPNNNSPALAETISGPWSAAGGFRAEAYYDSGPENVAAEIYYSYTPNANISVADTNWEWFIFSSADAANFPESTGVLRSAGAAAYYTPGSARRYFMAQLAYLIAAGSSIDYTLFWQNLAVYGNHGLTGRGSDPVGFYPSDIAGWVIGQAPGLKPGVIALTDASGFILPHSAYYTPVGLDQMMGDMGIAAGWHWGVWESLSPLTGNATPRCDFRPRPELGQFSAFCLRRDTGLCDVREDLSQQYNRCVVNFSQVDGTQGAVIATVDNPILDQAGIGSRTLILSAGVMDPAAAALYGAEALALTYATARVAGQVQIDQAIDGRAPWLLKPGIDRLRIGDLPSFDAWGTYNDLPISRMEFSGSSSGLSTSLEVGSGADLVETLNARIASASFLAAQGG